VYEAFAGWVGGARIDYGAGFQLTLAAASEDEAVRFERQIAELLEERDLYLVARRYRRTRYGAPWEDVTMPEAAASDREIEIELDAFQQRRGVELADELEVGQRMVVRDTPFARDAGIAGSVGRVHGKAYDETRATRPLAAYAVALDDCPDEDVLWELDPDHVEREPPTEGTG
jgi:hypothetical protein